MDDIRSHLAPHMFCSSVIEKEKPKGRFALDEKYRVCDETNLLDGRSLCGLIVSCKTKMVDDKLCTLDHKTRCDEDLYHNQYLCLTRAPRYHKEMMAILKEGGHILCPEVPEIPEIPEIPEVDMTNAGTTETPPPSTSKEMLTVVSNKMGIL